ncbi:MAG: cell division protein ZapA [Rhizobiales bacterium]|nr:cell division protein ZapA [Hyphomicrobiales bacterium]
MSQVVVTVNGRPYTMQCDDGQEEHLTELGQLLDDEVTTIKGSVGQVGDIRLLLMSGLVIADRLSDALKRIEDLQDQVTSLRESQAGEGGQDSHVEEQVSARLIAAANRLEELAQDYQETN